MALEAESQPERISGGIAFNYVEGLDVVNGVVNSVCQVGQLLFPAAY